eukprot:GGOE01002578.1.p1 GENE.GGOE01002578.1~~GGOE01002578.1.p1  ORF type:complete len:1455 (+),score=416.85 GGOE01002578.1:69-4433(+)
MSKIRVVVRIRPFLPHEASDECVTVDGKNLTLANRFTTERHDFSFDRCYWSVDDSKANPKADNAALCEDIGQEALQSAVNGFNACIFAYGTTGSGKSYSIRGEADEPGVLPHICKRLFSDVISRDDNHSYSVRVSYFEIYNERVIDLLSSSGSPLKVMVLPSKDHDSVNVIVKDLEKRTVHSCKEMAQALLHGATRLSFNRTGLNDRASRSHSVFTIYLTKREGTERSRLSQIHVVDLAGSEHVKQSRVVGGTLRETCHINASLTTLSRVIEAVNTNLQLDGQQPRRHVPYRDSKLTTILSPSLGGNSKTFMIATISPSMSNYPDTLRTLKFAEGVGNVINDVQVNRYVNDILQQLVEERSALQLQTRPVPKRFTNPLRLDTQSDDFGTRAMSDTEDEEERYRDFIKFYRMMKESEIVRQYPKLVVLTQHADLSGTFYKIIDEDGFSLLGCKFFLSDDAEEVFLDAAASEVDLCVNGQPVGGVHRLHHGDRIFLNESHVFLISHLNQSQSHHVDSKLLTWQSVVAEVAEARERKLQAETQQLQALISKLEDHLHVSCFDSVANVFGCGEGALPPSISDESNPRGTGSDGRAALFHASDVPSSAVVSSGSTSSSPLALLALRSLSPSAITLSDRECTGRCSPPAALPSPIPGLGTQGSVANRASGSYAATFQRRRGVSGLLAKWSRLPSITTNTSDERSFIGSLPGGGSPEGTQRCPLSPPGTSFLLPGSLQSPNSSSSGASPTSNPDPVGDACATAASLEHLSCDFRSREVEVLLRKLRRCLQHDSWLSPAHQTLQDVVRFLLACSPYRHHNDLMREYYGRQADAVVEEPPSLLRPLVPSNLPDRRILWEISDCVARHSATLAPLDISLVVKQVELIGSPGMAKRCFARAQTLLQPSAPARLAFYACRQQHLGDTLRRGPRAGEGAGGITQQVIVVTPDPVTAFLSTKGEGGTYHPQILLCTVFPGAQRRVKDTEPYEEAPHGSHAFPWNDPEVHRQADCVHVGKTSTTHPAAFFFWRPDQVLPQYLVTLDVKDAMASLPGGEALRLQQERALQKAELNRLQRRASRSCMDTQAVAQLQEEGERIKGHLSDTQRQVAALQATTQMQDTVIAVQKGQLACHGLAMLEAQQRLATLSLQQEAWQTLQEAFRSALARCKEERADSVKKNRPEEQGEQRSGSDGREPPIPTFPPQALLACHEQTLLEMQQRMWVTGEEQGEWHSLTNAFHEALLAHAKGQRRASEGRKEVATLQAAAQRQESIIAIQQGALARQELLMLETQQRLWVTGQEQQEWAAVQAVAQGAVSSWRDWQRSTLLKLDGLQELQRHVTELTAAVERERDRAQLLASENASLQRRMEAEGGPPPFAPRPTASPCRGLDVFELHLELEEAAVASLSECDSALSKPPNNLSSDTAGKGLPSSDNPSELRSGDSQGKDRARPPSLRPGKRRAPPCCLLM